MGNGYWGRVLHVDLSSKEIREAEVGEGIYRDFFGGYGMAARLIHQWQVPGVDPLGEESYLAFMPGLLSGTGAPFSGRYTVAGLSPLTGTWGDANSGGHFGPELRRAGFDGVFVRGVAERPVYLWINDDGAELRDAAHLWGKDTYETEDEVRRELGDGRAQVVSIGRAGEERSLMAAVITERGRSASRSGLGAVMGAKRLKAVAVRGTQSIPLADGRRFRALCRDAEASYRLAPAWQGRLLRFLVPLSAPFVKLFGQRLMQTRSRGPTVLSIFHEFGTTIGLSLSAEMGDAPVKNWSGIGSRDFPLLSRARKISDRSVIRFNTRKYACADCPLACGAMSRIERGEFAAGEGQRPEYEALAAFGPMILNDHVESVIWANDFCNRHGLDVIEAGSVIALAVECFEKGLINQKDTEGLALSWGDPWVLRELLPLIAERRGFGDVLADGVARAAERIGRGAEKLAVHIHGQAPGMHDPKYGPSWATTYVADPTPGRHTAGGATFAEILRAEFPMKGIELPAVERYQYRGKGRHQAAWSHYNQLINCLGLCHFSATLGGLPLMDLVESATDWSLSDADMLKVGERIQNMRHLINLRQGLRPADFHLHPRLKGEPPPTAGPTAGVTLDVETMVADYFRAMDWDPSTGWPSAGKLEELGLSGLVER